MVVIAAAGKNTSAMMLLPAQSDSVEIDVTEDAHLAARIVEAELESALGREPDAAAESDAGLLVLARLDIVR